MQKALLRGEAPLELGRSRRALGPVGRAVLPRDLRERAVPGRLRAVRPGGRCGGRAGRRRPARSAADLAGRPRHVQRRRALVPRAGRPRQPAAHRLRPRARSPGRPCRGRRSGARDRQAVHPLDGCSDCARGIRRRSAGSYEPLASDADTCAYRRGDDVVVAVPIRGDEPVFERPPGRWRNVLAGVEPWLGGYRPCVFERARFAAGVSISVFWNTVLWITVFWRHRVWEPHSDNTN